MQKIGIMGGTFNPIHNGHLLLAEQAREQLGLSKIIFVTSGNPPHKKTLDAQTRLEMTRIATKSNPNFICSDIEVKNYGYAYSVDTVGKLQKKYPKAQLYFIIGADIVGDLTKWKDHKKLAASVKFALGMRAEGCNENLDIERQIMTLEALHGFEFEEFQMPALQISSTAIREKCNRLDSIKYMVPSKIEKFILDKELYIKRHPGYKKLRAEVRRMLKDARYRHSIGVSRAARRLAFSHGADPLKAEMGGLAHDYCKELDMETARKYARKLNLDGPECIQKKPLIAHGEIGAYLLKKNGFIDDEEILDSIRWHTYGRKNMQLLDKVVYVADIIDLSRPDFPGRYEVMQIAHKSLEESMRVWSVFAKKRLIKKKEAAHPNTKEMLDTL